MHKLLLPYFTTTTLALLAALNVCKKNCPVPGSALGHWLNRIVLIDIAANNFSWLKLASVLIILVFACSCVGKVVLSAVRRNKFCDQKIQNTKQTRFPRAMAR